MSLLRLFWPHYTRDATCLEEEGESVFFDVVVPMVILLVVAQFGSLVLFAGGGWEKVVYPFSVGSFLALLRARAWIINLFLEKGRHGPRLSNPNMAQFAGAFIPATVWGSLVVLLAWFL